MLTVNFRMFQVEDGDSFLDAGCGEGRHSFEACRHDRRGIVCAMDLDRPSLRKAHYVLHYMDMQREANGNWNVLLGDALHLPFRDACFDKIICSEVLEHVDDDGQGVREFVRVLKPGGLLAVTVPTYLTETVYWKLDSDYHNHPGGHVRIFTAKELVAVLRRCHLAVYGIRYEHAFHSIYWFLRCVFGLKNEKARIPALYRKFLEVPLATRSKFIPWMERIFNFFFPKSIVVYTRKPREEPW